MSGELQVTTTSAVTVYAQIRSATGTVWNTSAVAFQAYATATIANYAVALAEQGSASKYYAGTFPTGITTPGVYIATYLIRAGGSPAETDTIISSERISWTGAALGSSATGLLATAGVTAVAAGVWNALTATYNTANTFGAAVGGGATAANVWAYPSRGLTDVVSVDLTQALDVTPVSASVGQALYFAQSRIDQAVSSISGFATAAALSTAQADLTTLTGRLTSARAGYLDNLSGGYPTTANIATAVWGKDISGVSTASFAGTVLNAAATAAALTTAQTSLTTLTGLLTPTRAGYLDNLATAPPTAATIATAVWDKTVSGYSTGGQAGTYQNLITAAPSAATIATAVWDKNVSAYVAGGAAGTYQIGGLTATGVWAAATRTLTGAVTVDQTTAVGASPTAGTIGKALRNALDNLTAAPLTGTQTAAAVWNAATATYNAGSSFGAVLNAAPTAAGVADAVWDEAVSGHTTTGTFGAGVGSSTSAALVTAFQSAGMTLTTGERNSVATALLDLSNGVEAGVTLRQAVRYIGATTAGVASGGGTATNTFLALGTSGTTRVTSTVTATGNRTAVAYS